MSALPGMPTPRLPTTRRCLDEVNHALERMDAADRVQWALEHLPGGHALSSSFGAQAAVSLHLVTSAAPDIPVILIDTGYLFPETYRFVDELVAQARLEPQGLPADRVAGLARGAATAGSGSRASTASTATTTCARASRCSARSRSSASRTWFAGLRRQQARSRSAIRPLEFRDGRWKVHPILDWTDRQVFQYLTQPRPAVPPAVAPGLRVDRRLAHDAHAGRGGRRGSDALLRAEARVRHPRARGLGSCGISRCSRTCAVAGCWWSAAARWRSARCGCCSRPARGSMSSRRS